MDWKRCHWKWNSPLDLKNISENCPRGKLQVFIKDSTYLGERICTLKSQEGYYFYLPANKHTDIVYINKEGSIWICMCSISREKNQYLLICRWQEEKDLFILQPCVVNTLLDNLQVLGSVSFSNLHDHQAKGRKWSS